MSLPLPPDRLRALLLQIETLLSTAGAAADVHGAAIACVPPSHRRSAANLAHYLAVRSHDLRVVQHELASLSLSSLGRMEGHALHTLQGVRRALLGLLGELPTSPAVGSATGEPAGPSTAPPVGPPVGPPVAPPIGFAEAQSLLAERALDLLGPPPPSRSTRIMVTLPTSAAADRELLRLLLDAGMDIVRINLAHDDEANWTAMVDNLRSAATAVGRRCRVLVDLPGPKLRTGAVEAGPQVLRVQPRRDALGAVVEPARVAFVDPGASPPRGADLRHVPLVEPIAGAVRVGDELRVTDTRARKRRFRVEHTADGVCIATADRSTYFGAGCPLELRRDGIPLWRGHLGALSPLPGSLSLAAGDALVVVRAAIVGSNARTLPGGEVVPARIACSLPEVFDAVRPGQRILFDDGRIGGVVEAAAPGELLVRIKDVPPGGARLRAEKGINLPDTELALSALTERDRKDLDWIARHADLVGMSFVQRPADVHTLHAELARRGRPDLGIVLKVETRIAFDRLPDLLFAGLCSPPLGVMVARGDLAVEVGYDRLAEVQEEILWLCEAAHVPVIWATQVLDSMARTGTPSRAEVTDAAMGVAAECVMLNKGPFVVETVRFLANVLERMQAHRAKKTAMLRRLRVAGGLPGTRRAGPVS